MSNKFMITWGILVILIVSVILIIGVYYEKNYEYIEASNKVKEVIKKYLKEEDININNLDSYNIQSNLLKEKGYLEEIKIKDNKCSFNAKIKNYFIYYDYDIKYNCVNEILE